MLHAIDKLNNTSLTSLFKWYIDQDMICAVINTNTVLTVRKC
jgi:hypothetical protein